MANEERYWNMLQDYARGTLSLEDQQDIEKWLASNKDAKAAVDGFRQLDEIYSDETDISNYHLQRSSAILEHIKTAKKTNYRWYYVAAVIVLTAFCVSLISYFLNPEQQFKALLNEYSSEYYQLNRVRAGEELLDWEEQYRGKNYELVIATLNLSPQPNTQFFKALSHLYLEQYDLAIPILENLLKEETDFKEHSRWFLALAYFNVDQNEKGLSLLKEIMLNQRHFNQSEAKKLMSAYESEN